MNSRYEKTAKDLLLRTRGKGWDITDPRDQGFTRVRLSGSHARYYVRLEDLKKRVDRVVLYQRVYELPPLMYIAGPYSHRTEAGIKINIDRAAQAGLDCCRAGWAVHIPHKNFAGFHVHLDIPYDTWLEKDLSILSKCDAILLLEGWASSTGASREFQFAEEMGIPHYFARNGIPKPDVIRRAGHA